MLVLRLSLVVVIFIAVNLLVVRAPSSVAAVRVGGEAYGLAVGNPPVTAQGGAYVQLPPEGGNVSLTSPGAGYGLGNGVGSTTVIAATTSGSPEANTVTSTAVVDDGELFGGLIRATDVRVVASITGGRPTASITYGTLIVAGAAYPNPQINQRVELPGVGYVILNEQRVGGDTRETAGVVANAVHVYVTVPSALDVTSGAEVILAHAAAGIPDVVVSRAVAPFPTSTPTPVPWAAISTLGPLDLSLNGNFNGNDNFDFNGNENDNSNSNSTNVNLTQVPRGSTTPISIVITVVIVENTPTPTTIATPTATATTAPDRRR
ncbi:MAG: hypothetical protein IT305_27700 [Chloroflexi bacterium]|nr:hypothetical protein [Chloroflexota bacterium]